MVSFTLRSFLRSIYYTTLTFFISLCLPFRKMYYRRRGIKPFAKYIHKMDEGKSASELKSGEVWSFSSLKTVKRSLISRDGVEIHYYILFPPKTGEPYRKVMVFGNGLGVSSSFIAFCPLINRYGKEGGDFSFITWDYRGLFESKHGARPGNLAIPEHAEDLREILHQEQIPSIELLVGFSMGVQVAIEMTLRYPKLVEKLAFFSGTYGHCFDTVFQPFFRVPFVHSFMNWRVNYLLNHPERIEKVCPKLQKILPIPMTVYQWLFNSPLLVSYAGPDYLYQFINGYLSDVISSVTHLTNYLRLFIELDAHNVYPFLHQIEQPTLVFTGLFDALTPAYLSFEIADLLPNCSLVVCAFSSHCALLEDPERILSEVVKFIEGPDIRSTRGEEVTKEGPKEKVLTLKEEKTTKKAQEEKEEEEHTKKHKTRCFCCCPCVWNRIKKIV